MIYKTVFAVFFVIYGNIIADEAICNIQNNNGCSNVGNLFNYPLENLESNEIQKLINKSVEMLNSKHYFSIPKFLTDEAVALFLDDLLSNKTNKSLSTNYKTAWQDSGDYENFPSSNHSRNHFLWSSQRFIGKTDLISASSSIIDIYNYEALLLFLKSIVTKATPKYSNLFLSKASEGSVYGLIFENNQCGSWHLDEHPFSCVWMIQKSLYAGGSFGYVYMPPTEQTNYDWDHDLLYNIFNNDTKTWNENVKYHFADEGDIYCFNGNITLHNVNPVIGDVERVAFVTTFSETDNFVHKDSVNQFNIWGQHNT